MQEVVVYDQLSRRTFLAKAGLGPVALTAMLARDGYSNDLSWSPPNGKPHFPPRAKSVIWIFLIGGLSHLESFDPKPAINKYAGKTIAETPWGGVLKSPFLKNERITAPDANGLIRNTIFPLQTGFQKRGKSGIEVSDWWPHVGGMIDDVAVVRSLWTEDSNHGAQLQFHTGRNVLDGYFPTIGSWVHYGLGTLNENLPQFLVLGKPVADCCGGHEAHKASYLGPAHDGVQLAVDPTNPLPFVKPPVGKFAEEQAAEFELLGKLHQLAAKEYPADPALAARIKAYELAFRMQQSVPDVFRFNDETPATQQLYGLDRNATKPFGQLCLSARRLVERGVRFVQIFHGGDGGAGGWDAHSKLKSNHTKNCEEVDRPIAGLLKDLKQRGLLDETLVVLGTEFGRTPGSQGADGRDHHPYGFSACLAGGGVKGGVVHGATDELGFHAVEHRHYVTDIHATVLHQLGLDSRRLEVPGRKRLERDHGKPIKEILT